MDVRNRELPGCLEVWVPVVEALTTYDPGDKVVLVSNQGRKKVVISSAEHSQSGNLDEADHCCSALISVPRTRSLQF